MREKGTSVKIIEVKERTDELIAKLVGVWESAVRETHLFLSDQEIERIKQYVPEALKSVCHLIVAADDSGNPAAFMGIEGQSLEMLFVRAEERGKGMGKELVKYGIEAYTINKVSVNEQNPQAKGFYEYMGFQVYRRSETDEQGDPYPILYMKL